MEYKIQSFFLHIFYFSNAEISHFFLENFCFFLQIFDFWNLVIFKIDLKFSELFLPMFLIVQTQKFPRFFSKKIS